MGEEPPRRRLLRALSGKGPGTLDSFQQYCKAWECPSNTAPISLSPWRKTVPQRRLPGCLTRTYGENGSQQQNNATALALHRQSRDVKPCPLNWRDFLDEGEIGFDEKVGRTLSDPTFVPETPEHNRSRGSNEKAGLRRPTRPGQDQGQKKERSHNRHPLNASPMVPGNVLTAAKRSAAMLVDSLRNQTRFFSRQCQLPQQLRRKSLLDWSIQQSFLKAIEPQDIKIFVARKSQGIVAYNLNV